MSHHINILDLLCGSFTNASSAAYHIWMSKALRKNRQREQREREERELSQYVEKRLVSADTLLDALNKCDKVSEVSGPLRLSSEESSMVFFNFVISMCPSKAYISFEEAPEQPLVLKLQTVFEDSRPNMSEEERYYIANNWNSTKKFTRCRYNSSSSSSYHPGTFLLEYEILIPTTMTHNFGVEMFEKTLDMWHTSAVACMLHILAYKRVTLPFATHEAIMQNTIEFQVCKSEDNNHTCLTNQTCSICLEHFLDKDWVRRLPCMHVFHTMQECNIDTHLVQDKQCPVCRTPIDAMELDPDIPKKHDQPELARAVTNLQRRFNEFHNIVSNMRVMLQQLRQECRQPQPTGDQSPPLRPPSSETGTDGGDIVPEDQAVDEASAADRSINIHTSLPSSDPTIYQNYPASEGEENADAMRSDLAVAMDELAEEADVIRLRLCGSTQPGPDGGTLDAPPRPVFACTALRRASPRCLSRTGAAEDNEREGQEKEDNSDTTYVDAEAMTCSVQVSADKGKEENDDAAEDRSEGSRQ